MQWQRQQQTLQEHRESTTVMGLAAAVDSEHASQLQEILSLVALRTTEQASCRDCSSSSRHTIHKSSCLRLTTNHAMSPAAKRISPMVSTGCFASHASSTPAAIAFAMSCTARAGAIRRLSCCSSLVILPLGPNSARGVSEALPTGPGQMTVTPMPLAAGKRQSQT
jgi:hypothetical protein